MKHRIITLLGMLACMSSAFACAPEISVVAEPLAVSVPEKPNSPKIEATKWEEGRLVVSVLLAGACAPAQPSQPRYMVAKDSIMLGWFWATPSGVAAPDYSCVRRVTATIFGVPKRNYKVAIAQQFSSCDD